MRRLWGMTALLTIAVAAPAFADTVRLRSGKTVQGQFIGGDSKSVRVLLDSGIVSEVPLEQAAAVEFAPRKPASPPPAATPKKEAAAAPKPAPSPAPKKITVPSGTTLNVRLTEGINVDASAAGQSPRKRIASARWTRQAPGKPVTSSVSHQRFAASVHSAARR